VKLITVIRANVCYCQAHDDGSFPVITLYNKNVLLSTNPKANNIYLSLASW